MLRQCPLMLVILASSIVAFAVDSMVGQDSIKEDLPKQNLQSLLMELEQLTTSGKYTDGIELLNSIDVESFFAQSIDSKPTSVSDLTFLAYALDGLLIPGVPLSLETDLLKRRHFTEIPGTGDDIPLRPGEVRDRWFEAVSSFALKYNTRSYLLGIRQRIIQQPQLSEEAVRKYVHIDSKTWSELPIEVRNMLQILVNEQWIEKKK